MASTNPFTPNFTGLEVGGLDSVLGTPSSPGDPKSPGGGFLGLLGKLFGKGTPGRNIATGVGTALGADLITQSLNRNRLPVAGDRSNFQDFPVAFQTLMDILGRRGQTDQRLFNRQLVGIGRGTEAERLATEGSLAQAGLQQSGVGQALLAAIGQAGQDRLQGARAEEAARAEERARSDIERFILRMIDQSLTEQATRADVSTSNAALSASQDAARTALFAEIIGAFAGR